VLSRALERVYQQDIGGAVARRPHVEPPDPRQLPLPGTETPTQQAVRLLREIVSGEFGVANVHPDTVAELNTIITILTEEKF
jgi:hypothetical protein